MLAFAVLLDVVPAGDAAVWPSPPVSRALADGAIYGHGTVHLEGALAAFGAADAASPAARGPDEETLLVLLTGGEE